VACLVDLVVFGGFPRYPDAGAGTRAFVLAYAAAGFAALLWRRRHPVTVFAVLWAHSMLARELSFMDYQPTVGVLVALYAVATHRRVGVGLAATVASLCPDAFAVARLARSTASDVRTVTLVVNSTFYLILSFTVSGIGLRARSTRRQAEDLDYRREMATREAVHAERGWIARELHDTVAHAVTVIVLQAAGARRIIDNSPGRASLALETIEDVAKQTMDEMRQLLAILHTGDPASGATAPGYQLGLKDLDSLFRRIRVGGVSVGLQIEGEPTDLDPGVDLAAYRTVQETLTNATRHSGPGTQVTVQLIWSANALVVAVTDDGSGAPEQPTRTLSTGHGLVGLGERIALLGGRLQAGPAPDGGFRVSVTLPVSQPGPTADALFSAEAAGVAEQRRGSW
jgi:signal transduction histidine kinase